MTTSTTPPQRRPRVFLICQPSVKRTGETPTLTPLGDHGDVVVLLESARRTSNDPRGAVAVIEGKLADFDYDRDAIAWAGGDTLAAVLVGAALENMQLPHFTWLRYDRVRLPSGEWTEAGASYTRIHVPLG